MIVRENVPLAPFSTLHVGGRARYFVAAPSCTSLCEALSWAEDHALPFFILGGGSNTLFRDEGFPGIVIKMEQRGITVSGTELRAHAGVVTRLAVTTSVHRGLTGLERLAGIPGTIGGAVRGNAGSFGSETKDLLTRVEVLHRTPRGWEEEVLPRESLTFGYRDSLFKRDPSYVICRAAFALTEGDDSQGERLVLEDLARRRQKQPYEFPSVGSVFKNPRSDLPAGKLIEASGCKGLRVGGAVVSTKHANFIVNVGRAGAADVLQLIAEVQKRVHDHAGVMLEEEIVII
jgi:UDP-N-acetylmuramate dehydrogenase